MTNSNDGVAESSSPYVREYNTRSRSRKVEQISTELLRDEFEYNMAEVGSSSEEDKKKKRKKGKKKATSKTKKSTTPKRKTKKNEEPEEEKPNEDVVMDDAKETENDNEESGSEYEEPTERVRRDQRRTKRKKPESEEESAPEEDDEEQEQDQIEESEEEKPKRKKGRKRTSLKKNSEAKESEEDEKPKKKKKSEGKNKSEKKAETEQQTVWEHIPKIIERSIFNPEYVKQLSHSYPDKYFEAYKNKTTIDYVNAANPLELVPNSSKIVHPGHIYNMAISHDGEMLATVSTLGTIRIFDTDTWELIQELTDDRTLQCTLIDKQESGNAGEERFYGKIEEFYVVQFAPDDRSVVVGGKCKDRYQWDEADADNKILPCPLKVFDLEVPDKPVAILKGHTEEVLCLKSVWFREDFYYVSGSYDGSIRKWRMDKTFKVLVDELMIMDGVTNTVLTISFVPNTGNKYFLAGCDSNIKLFDFEKNQLLQSFDTSYSTYCDCIKFIPYSPATASDSETSPNGEYYFITRGVENLTEKLEPVVPNQCHLRKLVLPKEKAGQFQIEEVRVFHHPEYESNSWLVKLQSNGRYIFAPSTDGRVFVFSIETGTAAAIFHDHSGEEVRDVVLHPTKKLLLTCGDDSTVKVYGYASKASIIAASTSPQLTPSRKKERRVRVATGRRGRPKTLVFNDQVEDMPPAVSPPTETTQQPIAPSSSSSSSSSSPSSASVAAHQGNASNSHATESNVPNTFSQSSASEDETLEDLDNIYFDNYKR